MDANGVERVKQLESALARSLALLERGNVDAARAELARVAPAETPEPLASTISDRELDAAFEQAEPERENMLDADAVAEAAIEQAERAIAADDVEPEVHAVGEQFATATMAELLERQGDARGASRIRAALDGAADAGNRPPRPSRETVIGTLETWLANLRQGAGA